MHYYTNILFDLDGTLLDTKPGVLDSVRKMLKELHREIPPDEKLQSFMGPPVYIGFTQVCGLEESIVEEATKLFRTYYGKEGVFDSLPFVGIVDLLKKLKAAGYRLGVATSKSEEHALSALGHQGITDYFAAIAGPRGDEITSTKEDSIRMALAAFGDLGGGRTVLIGDRKFDAEGAKKVGIDSIGILYGYGNREELQASIFDHLLETVNDL